MKPSLNSGGEKVDDIVKLFYFLLPPQWVTDIMKYTNAFLDDRDALNANKLTEGELLRFWGYMISLSLHPGARPSRRCGRRLRTPPRLRRRR